MQLRTMRAYAKQRGWSIGMEVRDVGSGANVRPQREAMHKAARRRELDIIMVWRLDRWGRSLLEECDWLMMRRVTSTSIWIGC
jgi:putative DNA-invertase from lambdoid prophage Rac